MRILHVAEALQGGVATYLNELLGSHRNYSPSDRLLLVCPEHQVPYLGPALQLAAEVRTYSSSGRNPASLLRLRACFDRAVRQWSPDVIHLHGSFAGAVCRWPIRGRRVPLLYCAHGWAFDRELPAYKQKIYAGIERLLAIATDRIIAISEHDCASAIRAGLRAELIATVRLGLSPDRTLDGERSVIGGGPLRLLFIGRFDRQKGLDWLLDLVARLGPERVQLTLIGSAVLAASAVAALPPGVTALGWVAASEIDRHVDAADAVIMPSRWEGFGLVALEAMRRAVPVLVSDRGALAEVVGDGGFVFPLESTDVAAQLLTQLDRPTLLAAGRRGRERFLSHFRSERMVSETLALYRELGDRASA